MVNLSIQEWVELNLKPKAVCVIIFGWKKTKLKLMTLKVPQLIYPGIFFELYMEHKEKGWKLPPKNWVKLNFDAAIEVDKTIIALIARNEKRKLLLVRTEQFKPSNPLLEEAKAALFVVKKYVKDSIILLLKEMLRILLIG